MYFRMHSGTVAMRASFARHVRWMRTAEMFCSTRISRFVGSLLRKSRSTDSTIPNSRSARSATSIPISASPHCSRVSSRAIMSWPRRWRYEERRRRPSTPFRLASVVCTLLTP